MKLYSWCFCTVKMEQETAPCQLPHVTVIYLYFFFSQNKNIQRWKLNTKGARVILLMAGRGWLASVAAGQEADEPRSLLFSLGKLENIERVHMWNSDLSIDNARLWRRAVFLLQQVLLITRIWSKPPPSLRGPRSRTCWWGRCPHSLS